MRHSFVFLIIFFISAGSKASLLSEYDPIRKVAVSLYVPEGMDIYTNETNPLVKSWELLVKAIDDQNVETIAFTNLDLSHLSLKRNLIKKRKTSMYIRDWHPLSIVTDRLTPYYSIRQKFNDSNVYQDLLKEMGIQFDFPEESKGIEGGNILIGGNDDCYFAALRTNVATLNSYSQYLSGIGCKKIVRMNPLPNEGTGHIDVFLKFINKKTVLLAYYPTEKFQAVHRNSYISDPMSLSTRPSSYDALIKNLQKKFTGYKNSNELQTSLKISESHIENKIILEKQGYNVILVENPAPVFMYETDPQNNIVTNYLLYPTYLNGLALNGVFLKPSYPVSSKNKLDKKIENLLGKYFKKVISVNSEPFILGSGGIHCVTSEIH